MTHVSALRDGAPSSARRPSATDNEIIGECDNEKDVEASTKYKIQIGLNPPQKSTLFALRKITGVDSAAQVVRDALRIYNHLVTEMKSGRKSFYIKDTETGEVKEMLL